MADKQNFYGLFVGQNASTGDPNTHTGKLSTFGNVMRFDSAGTRQYYLDIKEFDINHQVIVPGGRGKMREFCFGMSLYNFTEYLDNLDIITMSDLSPEQS